MMMNLRYCHLNQYHMGVLLVLLTGTSYLSSCGYSVAEPEGFRPGARLALSVEPFINLTRIPMLEIHTARALRQSIVENQTFNLVQTPKASQRLQGIVQQFRQLPVSFDANDNAQQYRIEADIVIRIVAETSPTIFFEQKISAWAMFLVSNAGDVRENAVAREAAMFRLAQQFANKSVSLLATALY
jgi:hypothetical protein